MTAWLPMRLRFHARETPERVALTFIGPEGTRELTFGALLTEAERIAARLRADLPWARRALLLHRPGPEFLAALCGCWLADVTPIPTYPPGYRLGARATGRFERLVADADPHVILVDGAGLARAWQSAATGGLPRMRWLATDTDGPVQGGGPLPAENHAGPDGTAPALIQYTSGSTGTPRGVCLSHANLEANLAAIAQRFAITGDQRIVTWLPPYHDMGLIGGLLPLLAFGTSVVQMAPATFAAQPLRWLEAISTHGAALSGGPNFAYELCARKLTPADVAGLDLSCWRVAFCGAEPVRPDTLRRFAALLAPAGFAADALMPCYGLAEATLLATASLPGTGLATCGDGGTERALCGPPAAGVALALVGPDGRRCAAGEPGEIWLAGDAVAAGYWRNDALTAAQFGQRLPDDARDWMRTGDLGVLHGGALAVTGRLKDLIIQRGRNVDPADLEDAAARSHPALDAAGIAAFGVAGADGEAIVLACELRRGSRHADPAGIGRAVQAALADMQELRADRIVLLRPGALPRTTSGKISRSAARTAWLDGTLAGALYGDAVPLPESGAARVPAAQPPTVAIAARIAGVPVEQVDAGWTLGELGIDSLKSVELALALEHELGTTVPPGGLNPCLRLGELDALLRAANAQAKAAPVPPALPVFLPPSPQQLAFLDAGVAEPDAFIEIVYLRTPRAVSRAALEGALRWLAQRHPALTLRFVRGAAGWEARTAAAPFALERLGTDTAGDVAGDGAAAWRRALRTRIGQAIGIEHGALAHAVWLDRGPLENGVLVLALHHLIVDAVSVAILVTGLQQAYERIVAGAVLPSPGPDGYAHWLQAQAARNDTELEQELAFWEQECGPRTVPPQPAQPLESGAQFRLDPERNRRFLARFEDSAARRDTLLAAFAHAWMAERGEPAALVRLEHHGRDNPLALPAAGAVGWMVSFYPLRVAAREGTPAALVATVQRAHAALPGQGAGYARLRHGKIAPALRERMLALQEPVLGMSYRGTVDEGFRRGGVFPVLGHDHPGGAVWAQARAQHGTLPVLEAHAALTGGMIVCSLLHQPDRVPIAAVRSIAARMEAFVAGLLE